MKIGKKFLTMFGVMALTASSLVAGGVATAQSVDTSISVVNSSCVDEMPTSFSFAPSSALNYTRNVGSPAGINTTHWIQLDSYVNTCLEQSWTVTANMTGFTSGTNTLPASAFRIKGYNFSTLGNVVRAGTSTTVTGTTGMAWETWRPFNVVDPAGGWTINTTVATGTASANGAMTQLIMSGVDVTQIPSTTQGGLYTGTFTLTFTSEGP